MATTKKQPAERIAESAQFLIDIISAGECSDVKKLLPTLRDIRKDAKSIDARGRLDGSRLNKRTRSRRVAAAVPRKGLR